MSAAILDQRRKPIGISRGVGNPGHIGRKYRKCCIEGSYAESFGASYPLGLLVTILPLPMTSQNCEGSKGNYSEGNFFRFANACLESADRCVAQSGRYKPTQQASRTISLWRASNYYWVHVAIDQFTGQVIDKQIEVV
jgi:hypothetical protein